MVIIMYGLTSYFTRESVDKGLGTCMMNALSYCVIDTPDQAYVLDLMNSYNFRCEPNNLEGLW